MKILILGADGYLGWPTTMNLSMKGYEVLAVDNYLRRNLARETNSNPLYSTPNLNQRSNIWKEATGKNIDIKIGDLRDWSFVAGIFENFRPDAIVHYAEQPSAPFSMMSRESASLTLKNNLEVTSNIIFAVKEFCPTAHIIKLGTMGEYGTPNIDIEEGWLTVSHKGRDGKFLYPRQAGSLYHTTKIMDTDLLWFYVRAWGLRVTDLMQGPVYGLETDESGLSGGLETCFSYDELFGTVLNRFAVQAVAGYPLTVYGKGGQTRGYLNIKDTLNCIRLAIENPAQQGELRIFNQFTETFTVNQLAEKIIKAADTIGINATIKPIENPRLELEEHYYNPAHTGLIELGLEPNLLTNQVLVDILEKVQKHKSKIDVSSIFRGTKWA